MSRQLISPSQWRDIEELRMRRDSAQEIVMDAAKSAAVQAPATRIGRAVERLEKAQRDLDLYFGGLKSGMVSNG